MADLQIWQEDKRNTRGGKVIVVLLQGSLCLIFMQEIQQLSQKDTLPVEFQPILLSSSSTNFTKVASVSCEGTGYVYLQIIRLHRI